MGKKTLNITLYMSELVYDFQNKAFLTGRSRRTDATAELASSMQASDDDEDLNQTLRSIQGAYGKLLTELSDGLYGVTVTEGATSSQAGDKADNELLPADSNLTLELHVPASFVMALKSTVASCMHEYIVNRALNDWLLITNKADSADYGAKAQESMLALRRALYRRERPVRKEVGA